MFKINILLFFVFICFKNVLPAEIKYNIDSIPDKLTENANAVIRIHETVFTINSINNATLKVKHAVTILNEGGDCWARFIEYYDMLILISNIKANIYNAKGELILKVKKSDIEDYSAVSGYSLYEDSRVKYIEPVVNKYPYTVEYEYMLKYNGLLHYPTWQPIDKYKVSLQKAVFIVNAPTELEFRYKEYNLVNNVEISKTNNISTYKWLLENINAYEKEPFSPSFYEIVPTVLTAPNDFKIGGYSGNMETWKNMGIWQNKLLSGRDELPEETISEIKKIVYGIDDDIIKLKKIYEYIQSKTRYVSIQLGIGGWQPFPASDVDKVGYGDCKALSNYTKALLKNIGIDSYYTIVKAGKAGIVSNIHIDFPSRCFNHVILCVPVNNDTIWLECTSQTNPFGYIGNFTDDRDVLLIKENGGEIAHTKVYNQSDNTQYRKATITLNENGEGNCEITTKYAGLQYDNIKKLFNKGIEDKKKILYKHIDIENININNVNIKKQADIIPEAELNLSLKLNKYTSITGKRMFVPLNLMNKRTYIPKKLTNRKTEILLKFAYHDTDTIIYYLPENFEVEYLPKNTGISSQFGEYSTSIKQNGNIVTYVRDLKMNKGRYPASEYEKIRNFYKNIAKADNVKLILKRKE
ncbi:MAG: DUF3857 domain-containing protein [Bacteroidales bacterium]|nr:DUF3857 domain-containing protein [Bacteroidales bacterium]